MGADFLYDRYGSAPDIFAAGDFVYDYLGISEYNVQSYGDDGGLGVPQLDPVDLPGIILPHDKLFWIYSTAWWVDGCTPAGDAVSVYNMGPDTYPFNGLSSAILNNYYSSSEKERLSFFFDPAIIDTYGTRVALFEWSYYALFPPPLPGIKPLQNEDARLIIGKNPVNDKLQFKVPGSNVYKFTVSISDLSGKQLYRQEHAACADFSIDISALCSGMYLLSASDAKNMYNQKFVVGK
jgi:hypothetical protein